MSDVKLFEGGRCETCGVVSDWGPYPRRCGICGGSIESRECKHGSLRRSCEVCALEAELTKAREEHEALRDAAELAEREIDGIFKYFLVSGLSEEGGGLPLYEQSKGLANARASIAAAVAQLQDKDTDPEGKQ